MMKEPSDWMRPMLDKDASVTEAEREAMQTRLLAAIAKVPKSALEEELDRRADVLAKARWPDQQEAQKEEHMSNVTVEQEAKDRMSATLEEECNSLRAALLAIEKRARNLRAFIVEHPVSESKNESVAQSILAVRHIEDARMRIGKVLQHIGDGVSCYDK